jgi:hypothetical protein
MSALAAFSHRRLHLALLAAAAGVLAGCMHPGPYDTARTGPFFEPSNFMREAVVPANVHRVVVLPIYAAGVARDDSVAALDPVFVTALQKQNRFEVVPLSREECRRRFQVASLSSAGALPHDFLSVLRRDFAADAVLFVDLTVFRAYRPLELGVRGKLAMVDDVRLVWSFDHVFSADDPAVANSARHHVLEHDQAVPADMTHRVLQSPSAFADYVASAMFATLPPVKLSEVTESSPAHAAVR